MAETSAPTCAPQRRRRITVAVVSCLVTAYLVDHRGCVQLARPADARFRCHAYLHGEPGAWRMSDEPEGSRGHIVYCGPVHHLDRQSLATQMCEWRWLFVQIDGRQLSRSETDAWRWHAAKHFGEPSVLLGDVDATRTIWLGYPLEHFVRTLTVLAVIAAPALPLIIMITIARAVQDPAEAARRRRLHALAEERCPACSYLIIGLKHCRCPECGESWTPEEMHAAAIAAT